MTTAVQERSRLPVEFQEAIEDGLRDIEEGRVISDDKMRKSLAKWFGEYKEEQLPEYVRKDIEEGERQLDAGLGIPHEAAMERLRQGFVVFDNLPDEARKGIEEGLKDIAAGRIHSHEEVEKELFE